eukprot:10960089-Lingulodinium_polyedra.AAC.1
MRCFHSPMPKGYYLSAGVRSRLLSVAVLCFPPNRCLGSAVSRCRPPLPGVTVSQVVVQQAW